MKRFIYNQLMNYKWHLLDKAHDLNTSEKKHDALEKRAYAIGSIAWKYFS